MRKNLKDLKRIVIKFGTNIITRENGSIALSRIYSFIESIADLKKQGKEIIIVTSGAVGLGIQKLGIKNFPETLTDKQACAAVGQAQLMFIYQEGFDKFSIKTAQVLLTDEDFSNRKKYLRLRNTLNTLLKMDVIPVINENDTISISELECYKEGPIKTCFGDNDKLSSLVMSKLDADMLLILTDTDGLYDNDPNKKESGAKIISVVENITPDIEKLGFAGSLKGRGGMRTKLEAAKVATNSGGFAVIANGKTIGIIEKIFNGENCGTIFLPKNINLSNRKRWIAYAANIAGQIKINSGAKKAMLENNASLLPIGVCDTINNFEEGDVISVIDTDNKEFARGIVNYSSADCKKITGKHSEQIEEILGYKNYDEIVHRDNVVLLPADS